MTTELLVNERIRAKFIRLIEDEAMIGVLSITEAMSRARARNLDLVLVAAGDVPVCRILDADRFRYERAKAEREHARRQRDLAIEIKEVQLRPVTDANDIAIKARKARGFLAEGNKVKVVVRFKGRERSHREEGRRIMEAFLAEVGEHKVERPIPDEGEMMVVLGSTVSKSELLRTRGSAAHAHGSERHG